MKLSKKMIIISIAVLIVLIGGTVATLSFISWEKTSKQQADDKAAMKKQAGDQFTAGLKSEKKGDTSIALTAYEKSYDLYVKLGDKEAVAGLKLKIEYMKQILEKAGQKVNVTVDLNAVPAGTSNDPQPSTTLPDGSANTTVTAQPPAPIAPTTPTTVDPNKTSDAEPKSELFN